MAQIETTFEFQIKGGELVLIGGYDEYVIEEIENYVQPEYNEQGYFIQEDIIFKEQVPDEIIFAEETPDEIVFDRAMSDENIADETVSDRNVSMSDRNVTNETVSDKNVSMSDENVFDKEYVLSDMFGSDDFEEKVEDVANKILRKEKNISDENLFIRIMEENLSCNPEDVAEIVVKEVINKEYDDDPIMVEEYAQGDEYLSEDIDEFFGGDKLEGVGWMV